MLQITIPELELWNEDTEEFTYKKQEVLIMEHSLVSLSKWESKWEKIFLSKTNKTDEEALDYIRCMTLTKNVDSKLFDRLTSSNINEINRYIDRKMTATTFRQNDKKNGGSVSSELIYYWMISLNIPFECQEWHLNRLLALIRLCSIKNQPGKKRTRNEILRENAELNAQRRKKLNTKG